MKDVTVERVATGRPHEGKVLAAIQAHADDIPLFCAGAIAKLIDEGYTGYLIQTTNDEKCGPTKSPGETIDDLNARAKGAGESLSNIAKPSTMVSGRAACLVAANGAPDCKAGADRLCQSKGYKEGKSLDTDAAEKCSPKVYLPGRQREPGDCKTENYVTRALCQ